MTPASPKCSQSSWGRQQPPLPARHGEKEQLLCSRAAFPSAARLAQCLPARCQAKFFAISRSTPASHNALSPSAACASLQPSGPCAQDRSIPKDPHLPLLMGLAPSVTPKYLALTDPNWAIPQMPGSAHSSTLRRAVSRECTACSLPLFPPFLRCLRPIPRSQTPKECVCFGFLKPFSHCHDGSEKHPQSQDMGWS